MRGKYSPTVADAYLKDQAWHDRFLATGSDPVYDPDGYDSYGYDKDNVDRAGNHESSYYADDEDEYGDSLGFNWRYNQALNDWGFDGVKPSKS